MTITLRPLYHRGKEVIALCTPYEKTLNAAIRKLPGVRWSQTHTVWYAPWGKESYERIRVALQSLATVDSRSLVAYLNKRSEVKATEVAFLLPAVTASPHRRIPFQNRKLPAQTPDWQLSRENRATLTLFLQQLTLKGYSVTTLQTYRSEFLHLLSLLVKSR